MQSDSPKKSALYTRTGDRGTTSLVGGARAPKNSVRLEAYGTVDELNSWLGMVSADPAVPSALRGELQALMSMMFNLGGYLATPGATSAAASGLTESAVEGLEKAIDRLDAAVEPMHCFVLPGGSEAAAKAHVARTVCRRAERRMLDLDEAEGLDPVAIALVNRLSDYLFALARYLNAMAGVQDTPWDKSAKIK